MLRLGMRSLGVVALLVSFSLPSVAADDGGMQVSAAVDMVGSFRVKKESDATDRLDMREAEVMLYGPIDHLFDGMLSLAAHREDGVSLFEIHEATISSSKLIPRSQIRVGQYFLGVGRLNRVHRHEWPFITTPKVQERFLGGEGLLDSGAEYTYLLPLPFYLSLTAGVTNGWVYGHAHDEGKRPRQPTNYARLAHYLSLFGGGGMQTGLNYLSRKSSDGELMRLYGVDLTAKWRNSNILSFLLQGEAWLREKTPQGADKEQSFGAYIVPQYGIDSQWSVGSRFDYYTVLTLEDAFGDKVKNAEYGVVPTLTYKASEFSTLRLAYTYEVEERDDEKKDNQRVDVQATFILGAHPAHDF